MNIFEMNKQYEVLDTFTTESYPDPCYQKFTNAEGIIFLLDFSGKVRRFDPFVEKKITKVQDLNEDVQIS